ncbi:helix-turn-helix domain-containing protein, partial [candidate division WOR-3 bacterium]|nr:helix-turn-helix domain-containing protein [candidate division WOR-3 bacterium]
MYNIKPQLRLNIVRHYMRNGVSLRTTAHKFNVHYLTVFKWVNLYKKEGEERLLSTYKRPWNRASEKLEEKVVLLKEREPTITVRKAKEILKKDGIEISVKGIWGIWKRYGYAGFKKEEMSNNFTEHYSWAKEATKKYAQAKEIFNLGNTEKSAQILNSIPVLPKNELLLRIPDCYLNLRRRVEKIPSLFGKIPVQSYFNKVRNLYEECRKRNLSYSALRLGIFEVMALSWAAEPRQQLKRTEELKNLLSRKGNYLSNLLFAQRFSLLISEGISYVYLSKIKKASKIARICCKLLTNRKYISPYFKFDLGTLYTHLEDFKKAEYWYVKCLENVNAKAKELSKNYLADVFFIKGEYEKAIHTLKNADVSEWGFRPRELLFQSVWSLINGMPHKAISLSTDALFLLEKEEVYSSIVKAHFIIASAYCSLGEKAKAESVLREVFPFVKTKYKKRITIFKILLSRTTKITPRIPLNENLLPTEKLALLFSRGDYWKAFKYAKKKGILSYFHRYVFFFPEVITKIIKKGRNTGLPKKVIKLPIFNKEIPVYNIKFLGNLIIYKNQQYLGVKPAPKDAAFLIHLAFSAGEPGKEISLESLYNNF